MGPVRSLAVSPVFSTGFSIGGRYPDSISNARQGECNPHIKKVAKPIINTCCLVIASKKWSIVEISCESHMALVFKYRRTISTRNRIRRLVMVTNGGVGTGIKISNINCVVGYRRVLIRNSSF